jgi:hypothetical protein
MRHARSRAIIAAAVLALALGGCGHSGSTSVPEVTLTVPGSPSAHVTDVVARGLTKEQADRIHKQCQKAAPIPGTDEDCMNSIPRELPPCTPQNDFCIRVALISGTKSAVIQVSPPQSGSSPACAGSNAVLCEGIIVPAIVVAPLIGTSAPSPTTSETTSEFTLTPTPTPTLAPTTSTSSPPSVP